MYRTIMALVVGILLVSLPTAFFAQQGTMKSGEDVKGAEALIKKYGEAFKHHDLDGAIACFAKDAVLMGTGPGELWVGHEEIKEAHRHFFGDFEPGTVKTETTWKRAKINGNVAWITLNREEKDNSAKGERGFHLNMTVVLEKTGGEWHFSSFHFSNLTGGE